MWNRFESRWIRVFDAYVGIAPDVFWRQIWILRTFMTALYQDRRYDGDAFWISRIPSRGGMLRRLVLEVPSEPIGKREKINAWATISLFGHAPEVANSAVGPAYGYASLPERRGGERTIQCGTVPSEDLERFGKSIADVAEKMTTYAGVELRTG